MRARTRERAIVAGLGILVALLLGVLAVRLSPQLLFRLTADPAEAVVGEWVPCDPPDGPDEPHLTFEFTRSRLLHLRDLTGRHASSFSVPYRVGMMNGDDLLLLGPDPNDDDNTHEIPYTFESSDILVLNGVRLRRQPARP